MSDLHNLAAKTKEGNDWRGTITVETDGEEMELTVRQLTSPEIEDVFRKIDRDELETLREELPREKMDRRRELLDMDEDERSDDEQDELDELNDELRGEHMRMFDLLSEETFDGIRQAARYGVVPSENDMAQALRENAYEIEEEYGTKVTVPEDTFEYCKDEIHHIIDNSTKFLGFQMGMKVLRETGGDEGNSES